MKKFKLYFLIPIIGIYWYLHYALINKYDNHYYFCVFYHSLMTALIFLYTMYKVGILIIK